MSFETAISMAPYPKSPPPTDDDGEASPDLGLDMTSQHCDDPLQVHKDARRANIAPGVVAQTVTPFLRDHVPGQYAPVSKIGQADATSQMTSTNANSKYCYRHQPDSKCRKAADESKMVALQTKLEKLPPSDQQAINHFWSLYSASPSRMRELMLQGVLATSCFPQLSMVAREVQSQLKIDFISALPVEISLKILTYLDTTSLCKAAQVSQQWRLVADDDSVWHRMCEQHVNRKCTRCGWGLPLMLKKKLLESKRDPKTTARRPILQRTQTPTTSTTVTKPQLATASTARPPMSPKRSYEDDDAPSAKRVCTERTVAATALKTQMRPWKDIYRDRFKIGSNWKHSRYALKILKGHTNGITSLAIFEDSILATGSYDSTIRIWNLATGEVIRTLSGHAAGIRSIQMDDSKLVSSSLDNTVKIWDWRDGRVLRTLSSHSGAVLSVHFDQDTIVSGSADRSIRVYNFRTMESFCLKKHTDWVNHVKVDMTSRTLLSVSDDTTTCLWDLDTKQVIRQFHGHVGHAQQIIALPFDFEPDDEPTSGPARTDADWHSASSSRSSTPDILQQMPRDVPQVSETDTFRASYGQGFIDDPSRPLPARYILSGGLDAALKLWDTATGRCVRNQFGHLEGIWAVESDALRVVSGSNDKTVKIWDPRSGRCTGTYTGHRGPVTSVAVSDALMASGSEDGEVRLYDFRYSGGVTEAIVV